MIRFLALTVLKLVALNVIAIGLLMSCQQDERSRIEIFKLRSTIFQNERNLRVYLPPGYRPDLSYAVLYLNDGQHLFGTDGLRPRDDWKVDETADSLIRNEVIQPLIIVGTRE